MFALEFPPISHLVEWPEILFEDTLFAVNKVVIGFFIAVAATLLLFGLASRKRTVVPSGVQNIAEASIDFVRNGIILEVMGPHGLSWLPFLLTTFFFVFFNNLLEVIPGWQMPGNARMAVPAFMALLVWVLFNVTGIRYQGFGGYLRSTLFPPGVPKALYILVTPIEFVSVLLIRPFSLAVRLFANLLAGHILLVTFGVLAASLWVKQWYAIFVPLPFVMLILLTGFELLVAFLQAYIFAILAAVYIGGAMHPEH